MHPSILQTIAMNAQISRE